ncbi:hypothetical protein FACS189429_5570 [Bacteroidia bacterium]|nr:hypothetical protein FACS189429_5570 [Bacteroidia bacterium]
MSGGVAIEHTFNPTISLGVQYYYLPVKANSEYRYKSPEVDASKYHVMEGTHHQGYLFMSANLLRVFNKNITTHWGIWGNLGLGAAYFNVDYTQWGRYRATGEWFKTVVTTEDPKFPNAITLDKNNNVQNAFALIIPVGVNIEYNFTKNLALGLKFNYTAYNRDDLEGSKGKQKESGNDGADQNGKLLGGSEGLNYAGVTNDFIASGFVNLRWKFNVQRPHTRNITWREYDNEALATAQEALRKQTVAPKDYDDEIRNLQDQIDSLRGDVDQLREYMSPDGPDDDGDGVPNIRDLEPNTPSNAVVDFYGRTIKVGKDGSIDLPAVFFDFDKYNLDNEAQQEIYKAAQIMKNNPNILCEVRAYCDYIGGDKYNKTLSVNRANRVKEELVKVYGISADRIIANGNGRLSEPPVKYRANRRAEFHFSE